MAYRFAVTTCPARFVSMIRMSVTWRRTLIGIPDFRSLALATCKSKAPKRILERSRAKEAMEDSAKERKSARHTSLGFLEVKRDAIPAASSQPQLPILQ